MAQVIASSYEIIREIGSGGGGIVYLGRHLRLDKLVVLKADKHSQSIRLDMLRREVDALKNLSHSYIPQVYDFVEEDGVFYTVMDYIEGESLDKPLKRGERFTQPQIVKWACELLDALCYLHSRPPYGILHSDIKPANIMLTPQGEIRLIDFNIALALGAEGAIRVGRSQGYASPEHYGLDFSSGTGNRSHGDTEYLGTASDPLSRSSNSRNIKTGASFSGRRSGSRILSTGSGGSSSTGSGRKTVMLDVRSDIYSLGATLYHLLTGVRPEKDAGNVIPISRFTDRNISPAIAEIVTKAMNPNPDLRYQSAEEMLLAFTSLHERDPRTRRHRRRKVLAALLTATIVTVGGFMVFVGLRQMERTQGNLVLAADSAEALRKGNVSLAIDKAMEALPESLGLFDPPYTAEAQRALTNALALYDMTDGYDPYQSISLNGVESAEPVKPIKARLSPDGTLAAVLVNELEDWRILIFHTDTGIEAAPPLKAESSPTSDFLFLDNHVFLYAGENGLTAWELSQERELWSTGRPATHIALSSDGAVAATVCRQDTFALIWNVATGEQTGEISFGNRSLFYLTSDAKYDLDNSLFALDAHGSYLAVSFADSSVSVYHLAEQGKETPIFDPGELDCVHFEGGFSGEFFAATASGGSFSNFILINLDTMKLVNYSENLKDFHIQVDETGIYLARPSVDVISKINPYAKTEEEVLAGKLAGVHSEILWFSKVGNQVLVSCKDGQWLLFDENANETAQLSGPARIDSAAFTGDMLLLVNQDTPTLIVQKWRNHQEANLLSYDPALLHLEANVHSDQGSAILFWRNEYSIVDGTGTRTSQAAIADVEQLRDQQYRRAGRTNRLGTTADRDNLELWYYDGLVRAIDAKTGEILFEEQGPLPEDVGASHQRNEEVMETEGFRVVAPVNGTPVVYDRVSGNVLGTLDTDGRLMYVYQIGDLLAAQYLDNEQGRFGLLFNRELQILADLPCLTDVLPDGTLVFDDTQGNLRQSRVYSIEEIIQLGRKEKEANP